MTQNNIENGNNVESCIYKNRINACVDLLKNNKATLGGQIIGKDNTVFRIIINKNGDRQLIPELPDKLLGRVKKVVIPQLDREGLLNNSKEVAETGSLIANESIEEAVL